MITIVLHLLPWQELIYIIITLWAQLSPHHSLSLSLYIYIYIFKIRWSTKRFIFFKFIYFVFTYMLCICMFLACCFRQRRCVAQSLLNRELNKTWNHSCFQYKWFLSGHICFYKGFCSPFLEYVYFGLLYPSLIFDMFVVVCVCWFQ